MDTQIKNVAYPQNIVNAVACSTMMAKYMLYSVEHKNIVGYLKT